MPRKKTPQEKKEFSYERDRRNLYGENSKSSRKNIPLRKRKVNRANRRIVANKISSAGNSTDSEQIENLDIATKSIRLKRWRKTPDEPLKSAIDRKMKQRDRLGMNSSKSKKQKN